MEGVEPINEGAHYFREFAVRLPGPAKDALRSMDEDGVLGGLDLGRWWESMSDCLLVGCDEGTSEEDIEALALAMSKWIGGIK